MRTLVIGGLWAASFVLLWTATLSANRFFKNIRQMKQRYMTFSDYVYVMLTSLFLAALLFLSVSLAQTLPLDLVSVIFGFAVFFVVALCYCCVTLYAMYKLAQTRYELLRAQYHMLEAEHELFRHLLAQSADDLREAYDREGERQ